MMKRQWTEQGEEAFSVSRCRMLSNTIQGKFKTANEDYMLTMQFSFDHASEKEVFYVGVVCDGMGGMEKAKESAEAAGQAFMSELIGCLLKNYAFDNAYFYFTHYRDRVKQAVVTALQEANTAVCCLAAPSIQNGSTLSAVVLLDNYMVAVNIGDSPIICCSGNSLNREIISVDKRSTVRPPLTEEENNSRADRIFRPDDSYYLENYLGKYGTLSEEMYHIHEESDLRSKDIRSILILSDGGAENFQQKLLQRMNNENFDDTMTETFEKIVLQWTEDDDRSGKPWDEANRLPMKADRDDMYDDDKTVILFEVMP